MLIREHIRSFQDICPRNRKTVLIVQRCLHADEGSKVTNEDRVKRAEKGIRGRLSELCSHMPNDRFEQMVRDIAVNQLKAPYYGTMREVAPAPAVIAPVTRARK